MLANLMIREQARSYEGSARQTTVVRSVVSEPMCRRTSSPRSYAATRSSISRSQAASISASGSSRSDSSSTSASRARSSGDRERACCSSSFNVVDMAVPSKGRFDFTPAPKCPHCAQRCPPARFSAFGAAKVRPRENTLRTHSSFLPTWDRNSSAKNDVPNLLFRELSDIGCFFAADILPAPPLTPTLSPAGRGRKRATYSSRPALSR